jgi:hypothetical protein
VRANATRPASGIRGTLDAVTDSLIDDLNDTVCGVAGCFHVADALHRVHGRIPDDIGAPEETRNVEVVVPVCGEHGHLFRSGLERLRWTSA